MTEITTEKFFEIIKSSTHCETIAEVETSDGYTTNVPRTLTIREHESGSYVVGFYEEVFNPNDFDKTVTYENGVFTINGNPFRFFNLVTL